MCIYIYIYIYISWKEHWISSGHFSITIVMRFGGSRGCACQTKHYACRPEALCASPISVSIGVLSYIDPCICWNVCEMPSQYHTTQWSLGPSESTGTQLSGWTFICYTDPTGLTNATRTARTPIRVTPGKEGDVLLFFFHVFSEFVGIRGTER